MGRDVPERKERENVRHEILEDHRNQQEDWRLEDFLQLFSPSPSRSRSQMAGCIMTAAEKLALFEDALRQWTENINTPR